jgi:hypothetical protein
MIMRHVYLCCIVALMLTARVLGQTSQHEQAPRNGKSQSAEAETAENARKAKEQQALKLLDQVIADSNTLKLPENRIHILATALGLVWPRDEKRARDLLKIAADTLAGMIASVDPTDAEQSGQVSQLSQVKVELFQAAVDYDPVAALDFLRRTPMPGAADQDAQMELNAAWQMASKDPQTALKLAEEGLAKGTAGNYSGILDQLRAKDASMAAQLATDILHKVSSEDLTVNTQVCWLGLSLIQPAVQAAQAQAQAQANGGADTGLLTGSDLKSLINAVVSTSVSLGKGNVPYGGDWAMARNALNQIQSMLPQIQKIDPELADKLTGQIASALQTTSASSNPAAVFQNLIQTGTADDIVKGAETAPASMREQYYQQAAWKAMNQDDMDKATQIVNDNYKNPVARQQMLEQIDQRSVWKALNQGKVDEARALIARLRSKEQRVQALVNLAASVLAKDDKKTAAQLLDEARATLPETPENYSQVTLLLNIAGHYARVEPSRGVQIMSGIAGLLSKLIPAGEALEGFDIQSTFRSGEMLMQPRSQLGYTMVQFAEQLGNLATGDYAAAMTAADGTGRPELRIMADLSIASKVLNEVMQSAQNTPVIGRGFTRLVELER